MSMRLPLLLRLLAARSIIGATLGSFGVAQLLSTSALGQSATPGTPEPSRPAGQSATPVTPEESRPAEFPGMLQGGGVVAPTQPSWCRPWSTQRNVALVATAGAYNGFGLGLRGGAPRVGLDASFAFFPVLATYSPDQETFPKFKLLFGYEASASIYLGFFRPDPRTDLGITFGYKYSSLLRHGVGVAFYLQRELSAHWTLQAFVGPSIFPDAEDQIRRETGWIGGSVSSGLAWHQGGVGISLAFFP